MENSQYLDMFLDESREHLQNMNDNLLALENSPDNVDLVNEIFRSAHTLKGMSATMGFENMADLTHKLENILDAVRNHQLQINADIMDVLLAAVDRLEGMLENVQSGEGDRMDVSDIVAQLQSVLSSPNQGSEAPGPAKKKTETAEGHDAFVQSVIVQSLEQGYNVFRATVTFDESCVLKGARAYMVFQIAEQMGDIIQAEPDVEKLEAGEVGPSFTITIVTKESQEDVRSKIMDVSEIARVDVVDLKTIAAESAGGGGASSQATDARSADKKPQAQTAARAKATSKTIRVNLERLNDLMNLFEELVIEKGRLEGVAKKLKDTELIETAERIARTSSSLQEIILNLRMEPIEQVFNRFPRMVRSVSKELNKKIRLQIEGAETELDRTVIDEIGDPLVHLLRNSMDHGIELPEVRRQNNKPEEGSIVLKAYHSGNHVFIEIEDDGAGINREKVLQKAIKNGLVSESDADKLSDREVYQFLFQSGFSTADKITDISGRGVGLDVVKSKIESLGGVVEVESEPGKGTRFTIRLPLTLSIINAMLIRAGGETYAVPVTNIVETALYKHEDIMTAQAREMIDFRGRVIPFLRLSRLFDLPEEENKGKYIHALVLQSGRKTAALAVDQLIGQQEIVIKSLGTYLGDVPGISGATILGDGKVALIIDCASILYA